MSSKRLLLLFDNDLPSPHVEPIAADDTLPVESIVIPKGFKKAHGSEVGAYVSPDEATYKQIVEESKLSEYDCFKVAKAADLYCLKHRDELEDGMRAYFDMWHAQFAIEMAKVREKRNRKAFHVQLEKRLSNPANDPRNYAFTISFE